VKQSLKFVLSKQSIDFKGLNMDFALAFLIFHAII